MKVAFFDAKPYDIRSFDDANAIYNFKIKYFKNKLNPDTVIQSAGYDVICAFVNDILNKEVINSLYQNSIKLIALRCAGYNNVDLKEVYKKVHVVRVPAYSPHAVAEHAVALILTLNRKIHRAYFRTHDNNFNIDGLLGFDLYNKTAGIIGAGQIGKIVIEILRGFGMKVLAYNPFTEDDAAKKLGFKYVDLDTIYKESDIISLHCPLNKETYHIINKDSIGKMKDNVMIINTGRGQLIDTKELIMGLKNHKIGYAGLDVYEEESDYFFEDFSNEIINDDVLARLLTFPNVLITSHQAFFTKEALKSIADTTLQNIKDFYTEQKMTNEVCYMCDSNNCLKKTTGRCF
ncbi:MAG: 2-hydroxyacid dehydrogenase [Spirochaetes bacterium]|nr:2-hydroxyacid dehydrogenase [Spirochaetota bacterium]